MATTAHDLSMWRQHRNPSTTWTRLVKMITKYQLSKMNIGDLSRVKKIGATERTRMPRKTSPGFAMRGSCQHKRLVNFVLCGRS